MAKMKNQLLVLALLLLILLAGASFVLYQYLGTQALEEAAKNEIASWGTYRNDAFGYSLKYPGDQLKIEEARDPEGETVIYLKTKEAAVSDYSVPGIEIKVASLDKAWHLKQSMMWVYGAASRESSRPPVGCENCEKNVVLENVVIDKRIEAIKMYNREGIIGLYPPYHYTFFFTTEDKVFLISFIQPENSPTDYLPLFNRIFSTFEII